MGRAEVGSTKHIANQQKAKGLGRLRWYCEPCEKQCRDQNGFNCHVASESHVRNIQAMGVNLNKHLQDYSNQFESAFIDLLRTSHREKAVHINRFYQTYIADKHHVHMNATKWSSLTEFAQYLGKEGKCRVEEKEGEGIFIAWIDRSPDALRRQGALEKKEKERQTDERIEQRQLQKQVRRAEESRKAKEDANGAGDDEDANKLELAEGQKVSLSFGKPVATKAAGDSESSPTASAANGVNNGGTKPKNVFAPSKKNVFKMGRSSGKTSSSELKGEKEKRSLSAAETQQKKRIRL